MAGFVTRDRTVASARKVTLATLPISPSSSGMTSMATRASCPAFNSPIAQNSSPDGVFASPGLAGGMVVISDVP